MCSPGLVRLPAPRRSSLPGIQPFLVIVRKGGFYSSLKVGRHTPRSKAVIAAGRTAFPRHRRPKRLAIADAIMRVVIDLSSWVHSTAILTVQEARMRSTINDRGANGHRDAIARRTANAYTAGSTLARQAAYSGAGRAFFAVDTSDRTGGDALEVEIKLRQVEGISGFDYPRRGWIEANAYQHAQAGSTLVRQAAYSGVGRAFRIAVVAAGRRRVTLPETQAVSVSKIQTRERADALVGRNLSRGME
ncbi:hypothetical protein DFH08DRAFT_1073371 [Mycena albidolilacea]|uniref:Uncharacterized protein n=1 Tax=Mycena albidolilacea TaxID=1033008 RepID=A0AAD7F2M4_9AGAR|nr:hypothetical protein DFH08DRAFT_1073371 [Mycena albidolilacea]